MLALTVLGCEPDLVVGTWTCPASAREENDAGVLESVTGPVNVPWSTGFETGLCDLFVAQGYCYASTNASYEIVDAPARGKHALAFNLDTTTNDGQTRCVREGALPRDAIYGAWYYVPELHDPTDNWNLFHFVGGTPGEMLPGLWDVTLEASDHGTLELYIFGSNGGAKRQAQPRVAIPIGSWFHIEFLLRLRSDATGEVELSQDGTPLVHATGIRTDTTDGTTFQQWYFGNLSNALTPPTSTVYVDDVSIRPAP